MRNYRLFFGILFFFVIALTGCRKDDISIIDFDGNAPYTIDYPEVLATNLPQMSIPDDNPMTVKGVELGRKLFYDPILSADNTQACADCHAPQSGFTDSLQFSVGIDGIAGNRNSMPIVNLGWAKELFWDGRASSLEDQAFGPVVNPIEMHNTWPNAVLALQSHPEYPALFGEAFNTGTIDSVLVSKALAQFERTLISGDSPFDRYLRGEPTGYTFQEELEMLAGFNLFNSEEKGDCFHCHGDPTNPLWTDNLFHNNGLDAVFDDLGLGAITGNPNDNGKFRTPTLRNLLFTAPYMHDGRFKTLSQVIDHYSIGLVDSPTIDPLMKKADIGGVQLTPVEKQQLLRFLESLTDSGFVTNPAFQKP